MNVHVAFADAATGIFTGETFSGPEGRIEANTLPGVIAWPYTSTPPNPSLQRIQDGQLVNIEQIESSTPDPAFLLRQTEMANAALFEMQQAEASQARPLRDILAAQLAGMPASADDLAMFHSLKSSIDAARVRYLAILAAQTPEALDAI